MQEARGNVRNPEAFLLVADYAGEIVGMALGMQGLAARKGTLPCLYGLRRAGSLGRGLGGRLVDALLVEARSRGYDRVQLWTHADNPRARRLYKGKDFKPSGRRKEEYGELIVHYQRPLPQTT